MKKLLFVVAAAATLGLAVPANAQVFFGGDAYGAGVQLGPVGVGVGPRFSGDRRDGYRSNGYYRGDRYGYRSNAYYRGDCRQIRSRVVRRDGRVVYRTQQVCR